MIHASDVTLRAGSELLLTVDSLRVDAGDRIGLVGRNGAGKTTLTRVLAQETLPASGAVRSTGTVGYLPQDPRSGDPEEIARNRILSARGLTEVVSRMQRASVGMGSTDPAEAERMANRYARALEEGGRGWQDADHTVSTPTITERTVQGRGAAISRHILLSVLHSPGNVIISLS